MLTHQLFLCNTNYVVDYRMLINSVTQKNPRRRPDSLHPLPKAVHTWLCVANNKKDFIPIRLVERKHSLPPDIFHVIF